MASAVVGLLLITGCALPQLITTETPVVTTNQQVVATTQIETNLVTGIPTTNTVFQTNTVVLTNFVTQTYTNWVASSVGTNISTVSGMLQPIVTAVVPQPIGGALSLVLGALGLLGTAVGGAIASYKNAQANLHQSTLQAVVTGVETALPSVQQVLTNTAQSANVPGNVQSTLTTANAVLSAVKSSIQSAAVANGTHGNLNSTLANSGLGPTAS